MHAHFKNWCATSGFRITYLCKAHPPLDMSIIKLDFWYLNIQINPGKFPCAMVKDIKSFKYVGKDSSDPREPARLAQQVRHFHIDGLKYWTAAGALEAVDELEANRCRNYLAGNLGDDRSVPGGSDDEVVLESETGSLGLG